MTAAVETMAYSGQVPWHGLGVPVSNDLTVEEMLIAAELDWEVDKVPMFYEANRFTQHGPFKQRVLERYETGKMALIRTSDNKMLSTVSDGWEPCQNRDAFVIFEEFVDRNELEMHTAGSLRGGELVWCLAKMKESFALFNDDLTEQYLLLVNPHIYGRCIYIRNTPIRVVCWNTLSMALAGEAQVSAKQSHHAVFDPEAMKDAIGIATQQMQRYEESARFLAGRRYTDDSLMDFFDQVYPNMSVKRKKDHSRNAELAMELIEFQPGAEYGKHTWWQAFNTVTYIADHVTGASNETRMNSAWFGTNADRKIRALNLALEYAEAA